MATIVRGSTIFFNAVLLDASGNPASPASANLYLVFVAAAGGVRQKVTVPMTVAGNVASATWDSAAAADGVVQWSVKAIGSNAIAQDGTLTLTANEANAD